MEISKEKVQVILALIERVQLSGKEAMTVAQLQSELTQGIQEGAPAEEAKPKDK